LVIVINIPKTPVKNKITQRMAKGTLTLLLGKKINLNIIIETTIKTEKVISLGIIIFSPCVSSPA